MFQEIYDKLCESRKIRIDDQARHEHHIIPKFAGGHHTNPENLCYLTCREHIIAHYLRWKIYRHPWDLGAMKLLGAYLTPQQRSLIGKQCHKDNIGFHKKGSFDISERNKKTAQTCKRLKIGIFNPDKKSEWSSLGGKKGVQNNPSWQYWSSLEGRKHRASLGGQANKGRKVMHKPGNKTFIRVKPENINSKLDKGYVFGSPIAPNKGKKINGKKVIVDNIVFDTIKDAAKIYKVDVATVKNRIKSSKFPSWAFYTES